MKTFKPCLSMLAIAVVGTLVGCSTTSRKTADVSESIRTSLDQAGLKDVSLTRSEEHTSELQSLRHLVCRLLLEKKKNIYTITTYYCHNSSARFLSLCSTE